MNAYRMAPAITEEEEREIRALFEHPCATCPACGSGRSAYTGVSEPRYCGPERRLRVALFTRCARAGEHLHQKCTACGFRWVTGFVRQHEEKIR